MTLGKVRPHDLNAVETIAMTDSVGTKVERKTKRRWWQFSLASLLLLMTVLAIFLGFWADSARRQQRAVQWVKEHEGQVLYSSEIQRSPTHSPSPPGPAWLRKWLGIDYLDFVETAYVKGRVTDADLATLTRDFPRLKQLTIEQAASVSDAGFTDLAKGLPHLTYLEIEQGENITDVGLAALQGLHDLERLHLDCPQMTDASLTHVESMQWLESLSLQSNHITDTGLAHLQPLKKLYFLELNCPITDNGMEHLTGLSGLLRLYCRGAPSDTARRHIARALAQITSTDFIDEPLRYVCDFYSDFHSYPEPYSIKFRIDAQTLAAAQVDRSPAITAKINGSQLAETLTSILRPHNMGWYVGEGEIVITTAEIDAQKHAGINKLRQTLPKLKKVQICW